MNDEGLTLRNIACRLVAAFVVCIGVSVSAQAAPVLTLNPAGGAIAGAKGATIGWGFTITNTTNFLEVTSSQFCLNPISTPFCTGSTLGTYTDIISSELSPVVVGPSPESTSVTQAFNASTPSGVGSFQISTSALNGSVDQGEIVLSYDLFSVSPNAPSFDPSVDTISTDNFLTAGASVTVGRLVATPEPGPLAAVGAGLGLMLCGWRTKRIYSRRSSA